MTAHIPASQLEPGDIADVGGGYWVRVDHVRRTSAGTVAVAFRVYDPQTGRYDPWSRHYPANSTIAVQ